ncbi:hypothetical protein, partial [Microcystis sp. LEGE 08355]|uniref:hypothetical protein n=1 Tax=Microcystis sp. LEGE 08355 TaxID=1828687 RepID=UPI001D14B7C7
YNGVLESRKKRKDSHYKKSITEAAAQVKGLLLFFLRSFPRKKTKRQPEIFGFSSLFGRKNPFRMPIIGHRKG